MAWCRLALESGRLSRRRRRTVLRSWRRLAPESRNLKRRLGGSRSARLRLRWTIHLTRFRLHWPVRLSGFLRHGAVEVVTGPIGRPLPAAWRGRAIPRLRPISPCIRWRALKDRPGWQRTKRHDSTPPDGNRRVSVSSR
jgi:hypothetical protein